jgi:hypothetical protein
MLDASSAAAEAAQPELAPPPALEVELSQDNGAVVGTVVEAVADVPVLTAAGGADQTVVLALRLLGRLQHNEQRRRSNQPTNFYSSAADVAAEPEPLDEFSLMSKTGLLDELAALEAELAAAGGDSMTETESVYGTERSVSQVGSSTVDDGGSVADPQEQDETTQEKELLSATGQLREELAAIDAELKAEGIRDDADEEEEEEEEFDEAAEAEDDFAVGGDEDDAALEDNLDHELQAEEDHQFILDSFRAALPVFPLKVPPPLPVRTQSLPQVLTRLRFGLWSNSDSIELAWAGAYSLDEIRLLEITKRMRRKQLVISAALRLQRSFRMHQAKTVVAEKRATTYAALKIQNQFRGRTARAKTKAMRDQLGVEIFEQIMSFDKDSNGFIDKEEFKNYMEVVGYESVLPFLPPFLPYLRSPQPGLSPSCP